jgi:hypothetical protein
MTILAKSLRRFCRNEDGTLLAEAVLVLPFMLWSYLALFVYWDTYRAINTVQKAAYTVSDMLSREMVTISESYIVGMDRMMEYLIDQDQDAKVRVTSLTWSQINNRYEVHWSRSPNNALPALTTTTIAGVAEHIPKLADGDYVVLFEAQVNYHPAFNVGINDQLLRQFIVTRPRFVPKVCLTGVACT